MQDQTQCNLHSSMDRLETLLIIAIVTTKFYLHSSMDRLETLCPPAYLFVYAIIYIPVWID